MTTLNGQIKPREIVQEMRESYLDYAMSVIVARALPDIRDGLKPVHRRILYAMHEMGLRPGAKYRKSATIIGKVLGSYHPHGDTAAYDSMVRMTQDFSLRYPLVDGQGNFGCFTKDTKVKLTDGRDLSFGELVEENKAGKKNYTYTISALGLIVIAEIKNPRLTRQQAELVEVTLDNGEKIRCTPDHRFMLRDGNYQEARDLKPLTSLMPIYRKFSEKTDRLNREGYISQNHKVINVQFLEEREDVYDLTIDGTRNFALAAGVFVHNSVDGDSAAAYRYTEAKLAPISEMLLADIEKDTVDFMNNYDETVQEPTVLPTRIPNLLLNGSMGIAVGMATNIPPHNLGEVIDGLIHVIDQPDADIVSITQFIKGPDFPTGGTIYNEKDILNAYATGKGPVIMRAKADIVESEKRGFQIVVSEIPYQVNKAELIIHIAELVKDKKVDGIKDVRDESDKDGLRVAIDLKQDAFPRKVLNQLFKYTELQKTFHFNVLGLVDGIQPQILGLKSLLEKFIEHRKAVVTRRAKYDLNRAQERAHILEGLKKALDRIDEIIKLIKKSESKEDAFRNLIKEYKFSDRQASAILEMRLQALAGLERRRVEAELKEKKELIAYFEDLLAHPKKILAVIKQEFQEIKGKYGDERRTKIIRTPLKEIGEEELIPEQNSLFMVTRDGYIKRIPPEALKSQKRGGKGLIGMATKEEDIISHFFVANTHDNVMFFTNSGKVFLTKGYEVPESTRQAKGKAIVNFLQVAPTDKITAVIPLAKNSGAKYLMMTTASGIVKKVAIDEFSQVRRSGMIAIKLRGDDELKWVKTSSGSDEIILTTGNGLAIRFKEKDIRPMGRAAAGVIGVRLDKGVKIVGADVVPAGKEAKGLKLLAVMANGYGKRTDLSAYKIQKRGGKGIITAKITGKTGQLVSAHITSEEDKEVIAVSKKGVVIRTELTSISELGRATQGVRIMKLDEGDAIASVVVV